MLRVSRPSLNLRRIQSPTIDRYAILFVVLLHAESYSSYVGSQEKHAEACKALGLRLKALRKKRGHSKEDMLSFGLLTRHWQQIEGGRPITLKTLFRACDAFEVRLEQLLRQPYTPESSHES